MKDGSILPLQSPLCYCSPISTAWSYQSTALTATSHMYLHRGVLDTSEHPAQLLPLPWFPPFRAGSLSRGISATANPHLGPLHRCGLHLGSINPSETINPTLFSNIRRSRIASYRRVKKVVGHPGLGRPRETFKDNQQNYHTSANARTTGRKLLVSK